MKQAPCFRLAAVSLLFLLWGCSAYMSGNMHLALEHFDTAIERYERHLAAHPDDWEARNRLGYAYLQSGRDAEAAEAFNQVLKEAPGDPFATYHLGLVQVRSDQGQKAVETLKRYRNPDDPELEARVMQNLGLVETAEAIRMAKAAIAQEARLQTTPQPDAVAVLPFADISTDQRFAPLSKAMTAMIISDLSQIESIQVLERVRIQALLDEMELGETPLAESDQAPRAGRLLGAENLIVGTLEPGSLDVKSSVASTSRNAVIKAFSVQDAPEQFFRIQKAVVRHLINALEIAASPDEKRAVEMVHTRNMTAAIHFGEGLDARDKGRWQDARDQFTMALEIDPAFDLARRYLQQSPGSDAPSLSQLATISPAALASFISTSVSYPSPAGTGRAAETGPAAVEQESSGEERPGDQAGKVSVQW